MALSTVVRTAVFSQAFIEAAGLARKATITADGELIEEADEFLSLAEAVSKNVTAAHWPNCEKDHAIIGNNVMCEEFCIKQGTAMQQKEQEETANDVAATPGRCEQEGYTVFDHKLHVAVFVKEDTPFINAGPLPPQTGCKKYHTVKKDICEQSCIDEATQAEVSSARAAILEEGLCSDKGFVKHIGCTDVFVYLPQGAQVDPSNADANAGGKDDAKAEEASKEAEASEAEGESDDDASADADGEGEGNEDDPDAGSELEEDADEEDESEEGADEDEEDLEGDGEDAEGEEADEAEGEDAEGEDAEGADDADEDDSAQ